MEIFKMLSPMFVGFLSAYFGSLLALNKFKKEKFWDERRTAYKDAIESFEELIHWAEYSRANYYCEPTIGSTTDFDMALRKISKYATTGSLLFSSKFHEILSRTNELITQTRFQINDESLPDLENIQQMQEWRVVMANEIRKVVKNALPELIKTARDEMPSQTLHSCRLRLPFATWRGISTALILGVILSISVACSDQNDKKSAPKPPYDILKATGRLEGRKVIVQGETNLPDNSIIAIEITQPIRQPGENEKRYPTIGGARPVVSNGHFEVAVELYDDMVHAVEEPELIYNTCEGMVSFQPDKTQSDSVLNLVGNRGEQLSGPQVETFGEPTSTPYRIMRTKFEVKSPFGSAK